MILNTDHKPSNRKDLKVEEDERIVIASAIFQEGLEIINEIEGAMRKMILLFGMVILTIAASAQQTGLFTTSISWTNTDGSQTRSMKVYVPTNYNAGTAYSLVIGLHGLGDTPSNYIQGIAYFATNSYFGNVILACPDEGTASTSWFSGDEDFKILSAVINKLSSTHNIDLNRVFAQGFSFGGKSVYLHGLDEADFLRGIIAYSPGFYSTADINNNCTDPLHCQHDYNYVNAPKILACITAGSGEYNLGLTEPYLDLAEKAVIKLNANGGDAIFIEDPTGYHNLPPLSISKQCWDHVNKQLAGRDEIFGNHDYYVYPNPAREKIYFETKVNSSKSIEIMNIAGLTVKNVDFNETLIDVSISDLASGIYFYSIFDRQGNLLYRNRFVVSR